MEKNTEHSKKVYRFLNDNYLSLPRSVQDYFEGEKHFFLIPSDGCLIAINEKYLKKVIGSFALFKSSLNFNSDYSLRPLWLLSHEFEPFRYRHEFKSKHRILFTDEIRKEYSIGIEVVIVPRIYFIEIWPSEKFRRCEEWIVNFYNNYSVEFAGFTTRSYLDVRRNLLIYHSADKIRWYIRGIWKAKAPFNFISKCINEKLEREKERINSAVKEPLPSKDKPNDEIERKIFADFVDGNEDVSFYKIWPNRILLSLAAADKLNFLSAIVTIIDIPKRMGIVFLFKLAHNRFFSNAALNHLRKMIKRNESYFLDQPGITKELLRFHENCMKYTLTIKK